MSEYRKVNWYNEELNKFYDTDKDNKGLIWGVYYLENEDVIDVVVIEPCIFKLPLALMSPATLKSPEADIEPPAIAKLSPV